MNVNPVFLIDPSILWLARAMIGGQVVVLLYGAAKVYEETYPPMHWSELPQQWTDLRLRHVLPVVGLAAAALVLMAFGLALIP